MPNQIAVFRGWWKCNPCGACGYFEADQDLPDCRCGRHLRWEYWAGDNLPITDINEMKIVFVGDDAHYFVDQAVPMCGSLLNLWSVADPDFPFECGKYRVISVGTFYRGGVEYPHIFVGRIGEVDVSLPFHVLTT